MVRDIGYVTLAIFTWRREDESDLDPLLVPERAPPEGCDGGVGVPGVRVVESTRRKSAGSRRDVWLVRKDMMGFSEAQRKSASIGGGSSVCVSASWNSELSPSFVAMPF